MTLLLLLAAMTPMADAKQAVEGGGNSIGKVVTLLKGMLATSKTSGDKETKLFEAFDCYCRGEAKASGKSIRAENILMAQLKASIEKTQGISGTLSSDLADLKAKLAANRQEQKSMNTLRGNENTAFLANKADLEDAIARMTSALTTLASQGADQTGPEAGANQKKFMGDFDEKKGKLKKAASALLEFSDSDVVSEALALASTYMSPQQQKDSGIADIKPASASFLQAGGNPGAYSAQSGQVVGILKNMKDTIFANLKEALANEAASLKAHTDLMAVKTAANTQMTTDKSNKETALAGNDASLLTDKTALDFAVANAVNLGTVAALERRCKHKTESYNIRLVLRANEEQAIAKAISILDSDDAFATFNKRDSTKRSASGGSASTKKKKKKKAPAFLQLSATRRHIQDSNFLSAVSNLVAAGNPMKKVLTEMTKMLQVNAKEGASDVKKIAACDAELTANTNKCSELNAKITTINDSITGTGGFDAQIVTLNAAIAAFDATLLSNSNSRNSETADRQTSNALYQSEIANAASTIALLSKSIKVLGTYYANMKAQMAGGDQAKRNAEDAGNKKVKAEGETWDEGSYSGQGGAGGADNAALAMLKFIRTETVTEQMDLHKDENEAQVSFEDAMAAKQLTEKNTLASKASSTAELADATLKRMQALANQKAQQDELMATINLMAKNLPGCTFVKDPARLAARTKDSRNIAAAEAQIKDTDVYKAAVKESLHASYGKCRKKCISGGIVDDAKVSCKACQADTTEVGYCAGHASTPGCPVAR